MESEVVQLRARLEASAGRVAPTETQTVRMVAKAFLADVRHRYAPRPGEPNNELTNVTVALAPLLLIYGDDPIDAIGPVQLRAIQVYLCEQGYAMTTVNRRVGRIRRLFKWAASRELVSPAAAGALTLVSPVRTPEARRTDPVLAPAAADVDRVIAWLEGCGGPIVSVMSNRFRRTLAAMLQVQVLTGMRPGEIVRLNGAEIDCRFEPWHFVPAEHKMSHMGRRRSVALGPDARAMLSPFLLRAGERTCFTTKRGTPWRVNSYGQATRRACDEAGVDRFSPNQLRHLAATLAASRDGVDAASRLLGHADPRTTARYTHGEASSDAYAQRYG